MEHEQEILGTGQPPLTFKLFYAHQTDGGYEGNLEVTGPLDLLVEADEQVARFFAERGHLPRALPKAPGGYGSAQSPNGGSRNGGNGQGGGNAGPSKFGPEHDPDVPPCQDCGDEITGWPDRDSGQMISARYAASSREKKWGRPLCGRCANKLNRQNGSGGGEYRGSGRQNGGWRR